jgi:ectoine hydroxylase
MQDHYPTRGSSEKIFKRADPVFYGANTHATHAFCSKERAYYERNGFVVLESFFSDKEVERFKEALETLRCDEKLAKREEYITEPKNNELRSIFSQHLFHPVFEALSKDRRILDKVEQILGSKAYIHHSRINIKPAYEGQSFPWHSDFETWHAEDGIPACRCVTAWVMLTDNTPFNGPLYLIPQSHKSFVGCAGATPEGHYKESLKHQRYGVPSLEAIKMLTQNNDLVAALGKAGTLVFHDGNIMHGSSDNISPYDRTNAFFVYNSVENLPVAPFAAPEKRAPFLSLEEYTPL